jgi:nucleotide-binding universal stress UspA family protein
MTPNVRKRKTTPRRKTRRPRSRTSVRTRKTTSPRRHATPVERPARTAPASRLSISHILVPIDFSVHSRNALAYAIPLAEEFHAELHLVYVVEPTIYPADLGFGQVVLPGVEDELRQKAADELQLLIADEIGDAIPSTASVRTGSPHQEILDEAAVRNADLIVLATHGHSGVEQILFGSTADRIVHHATCPVLTIRPVGRKSAEAEREKQ